MKRAMTTCTVLLASIQASMFAGCARDELAGPPTLRPGRDECAECGMLISEERCSSAMLVRIDGQRQYLLFDDIGCMLDVEDGDEPGREIIDRFVHDHGTQKWTQADSAWYVAADSDRLMTPMGSGLVAFASRASAEDAAREYDGTVKTWKDLQQRPGPGSSSAVDSR